MIQEELNIIVSNHKHWLLEDCDGWGNMRANLFGADLRKTNLIGADLSGADLSKANLSGADLSGADLSKANLSGADLIGADLGKANLIGADLRKANLSGADLSGAALYKANLSEANLSGADLSGARLDKTNLSGAKLDEEKNPMACPETGSFIGWKKCNEPYYSDINIIHTIEKCIIKLLIPEDAKRSSATTKKCRCSKAKVLEIQDLDGNKLDIKEWRHWREGLITIYKVGEMVYPDSFDECRWHECSNGIHFFMDRQDAVEY